MMMKYQNNNFFYFVEYSPRWPIAVVTFKDCSQKVQGCRLCGLWHFAGPVEFLNSKMRCRLCIHKHDVQRALLSSSSLPYLQSFHCPASLESVKQIDRQIT